MYGLPINFLADHKYRGDSAFVIGPIFYDEYSPKVSDTMFNDEDYPPVGPLDSVDYSLKVKHEVKVFRIRRALVSSTMKFLEPLFEILIHETLHNADIIIAATESAKRFYGKFSDSRKIRVIPEGVDVSGFTYTQPPNTHELLAARAAR